MSRRYQIFTDKENKYEIYQTAYDRLKMESQFLNPSSMPSVYSINIDRDRKGIESILRQLKGDERGLFFQPDATEPKWSYLKKAEERIKGINEEFKRLKQQKINEGRRPPKEMPAELQEQLLRGQAELDITLEEIEFLQKKLSNFVVSDQKELDDECLRRGPQGSGKLIGGLLVELDGQKVLPDDQGILRICDKRSPYNGLPTSDYFEHVVRPWHKIESKWRGEQTRLIRQARAIERDGGDPRHAPLPKRPPYPEWPANVPRPGKKPEKDVAPKRTKKN